ncbi:hypothetical protein [Niabella ginsengisoli]|uniref:Glycosyltransferase n=1 Tax=Niabella ginsengisoli TaxID=522298 RepID=A0ABS9SQ59_9BACT|nr:hypothetical protein [Niabella ginsengisoli]MCH5600502.1 hypothetical protein [Niabella ginsengisoli]
MSPTRKMKVLVAPLDWGLGHTTRCIPIITELLKRGVTVILAGNDTQKKILSEFFPECLFLPLKGYNIKYSNRGRGFISKMMRQFPNILSAIRAEHKWLREIIAIHGINGIISDNRFGLYQSDLPCIFITHQLQIKTGMGRLADIILRNLNYKK